jgi:hypothetical protein
VCVILSKWAEVTLILLVVSVNIIIGLIQEGKAEKAAEAHKDTTALLQKITSGRGGFCFELNGVLASLLITLKYDVRRQYTACPRTQTALIILHVRLAMSVVSFLILFCHRDIRPLDRAFKCTFLQVMNRRGS